MRRKLIAGNWKMNMTIAEGCAAVEAFIEAVELKHMVDVVICPPFTSLHSIYQLIRRTHVELGAQDVFWMEKGAFTGQVSAFHIADAGAKYCIVGHSETRGKFGKVEVSEETLPFFSETDHTVNLKIRTLLYHNIAPILCVGETLAEREAGSTDHVVQQQLTGALENIEPAELMTLSVAYEPVWAIGTGKTCDSAEADRVCGMIRERLDNLLGEQLSSGIRVLYGGSVKASNARELFAQPNIDGGLVGGASLDPEEFSQIVKYA
ncbi:MAG: triose-phosphate isomerase [Fimbriimonadaceae bacterium]|nr:triose-phosphate isomerase [Fimbriimonadaceae bacterium]